MNPFDLRPILQEHEHRRLREAGQERLAAPAASRWSRLARRLPRPGAAGAPLLAARDGGEPRSGCSSATS